MRGSLIIAKVFHKSEAKYPSALLMSKILSSFARTSLRAQLVKNRLQCRRPWLGSWIGKIRWRRDRLPTPVFLGFPCGSADKESACNAGDLGLIPGLGRLPGEGKGYPLLYSGLENSVNSVIHGGGKESDTTEWLSLSSSLLYKGWLISYS